jgi:hypothetical protein
VAKRKPKGRIVGKVKREKGCMYFVDGKGNVRATKLKNSKRKKRCK